MTPYCTSWYTSLARPSHQFSRTTILDSTRTRNVSCQEMKKVTDRSSVQPASSPCLALHPPVDLTVFRCHTKPASPAPGPARSEALTPSLPCRAPVTLIGTTARRHPRSVSASGDSIGARPYRRRRAVRYHRSAPRCAPSTSTVLSTECLATATASDPKEPREARTRKARRGWGVRRC